MRLQLANCLFLGRISPFKLYGLAAATADGRNRMVVLDDDSPNFISWLQAQGSHEQIWREAIDVSAREEALHPSLLAVTVRDIPASNWASTPPQVTVDDALRLCYMPLRILVENNRNDRTFLFGVCSESQKEALRALEDNKMIEFQNGGGLDDMHEWVKAALTGKPADSFKFFMIFDSDARYPGEPSSVATKCEATMRELRLCGYRLARRAIENYLPIETLRLWARKGKRGDRRLRELTFSAYSRLTPSQRYCFNLKHGFEGDRADTHKAKDLYAGVSASDKSALGRGFGKRIAAYFIDENINDKFLSKDAVDAEMWPVIDTIIAMGR